MARILEERFCGAQNSFVVWMISPLLHVFGMTDNIVLVDNENRTRRDAQLLDQSPIGFAKGSAFVIREHLYLVHTERSAPALLCEWQIHAHRENIHSAEFGRFFVEALGLC